MRKLIAAAAFGAGIFFGTAQGIAVAEDGVFNRLPVAWKWVSATDVAFTYDGTYSDEGCFSVNAKTGKVAEAQSFPEKYAEFPVQLEGAVNPTYSPDSTKIAFTRANDLYVTDIATGKEYRLTYDGTDLILNGFASWVYYEEIFGRPSRYKAFWWSPDSRKIGYYRFDNTQVSLFPIYSPFGQVGTVAQTRYPKAGQTNPEVRVGVIDFEAYARDCSASSAVPAASAAGASTPAGTAPDAASSSAQLPRAKTVWADFDYSADGYFGIPFWGPDSETFFVATMPRVQNTLELFGIDIRDGSKKSIYRETYPTWIEWISQVIFTEKGLYMARSFETNWEQIYFLSYDGTEFRRLTDGMNIDIRLVRVDEKKGDVYFTSKRDATMRAALYKVNSKGAVTALTDPAYNVAGVSFSPDGKYFTACWSNCVTPTKTGIFTTAKGNSSARVVADMAGENFRASDYALPQLVTMTISDGLILPAMITYPKNFDPSRKYPVHVDIYGGPNTPMVRDRWVTPNESNQWWSEVGIIQVVADCRAAGHNGRAGTDKVHRNLTEYPVRDFVEWASWLKALPYVDGEKIGVEGFSFGGTMTALLVMTESDSYHYGIAGGGVYDWALYDSHYTERYMDTPQNNPDGYAASRVISRASEYPVTYAAPDSATAISSGAGSATAIQSGPEPVMLKLTHGTGDDNVHFQNTLQLIDELQKAGKNFDFMIYPDGMHGYRGYQAAHFDAANRAFWSRYLLDIR